jgi:hypothetical protein
MLQNVWRLLISKLKAGCWFPPFRAGGADVLIDRERFELGKAVIGQMDATQDLADKHVLVLSRDYFKSRYCQHEMNRAQSVNLVVGDGVEWRGLFEHLVHDRLPGLSLGLWVLPGRDARIKATGNIHNVPQTKA